MARVLAYGGDDKVLLFNYRVDQTETWADAELRDRYSSGPVIHRAAERARSRAFVPCTEARRVQTII